MRERLYIETLQTVMNASSKVMVDVAGGNNMLYLPLDRMGGTPSNQNVRASGNTDVSADTIRQIRSEEHTSELQSRGHIVCRLVLEKEKMHNVVIDILQDSSL